MAIAYGASGTASSNSTRTISPPFPAVSAGDYLILVLAQKYGDRTVPTPSGWTLLGAASGGAGTDGVSQEGQVKVWVYGKEATGSESGALSITDSGGTADCFSGRIFSFTKSAGDVWSVVGSAVASDNAAGTSLSFTYDTDPGLTVGDVAVTVWGINSDAYTHTYAISVPGVSSVTTAAPGNVAVTAGARLRYGLVKHTIDAGTSTGVATYTNTASGSATNAPAGASVLVRLRVTASGTLDRQLMQRAMRLATAHRMQAARAAMLAIAPLRGVSPVPVMNTTFSSAPTGGLSGVAASNFHGASRFRLAKRRR